MAGSVTHAIFITDIYNRLDKKHKDLLKNNISDLRTYGQSHDVFYFSFNKRIKKMAIYAQRNKTQDFFINMIEYINKNKLNNNEYVMSYLFGNICHYCLDYNIHPFIKYKTGVYTLRFLFILVKKESIIYFLNKNIIIVLAMDIHDMFLNVPSMDKYLLHVHFLYL